MYWQINYPWYQISSKKKKNYAKKIAVNNFFNSKILGICVHICKNYLEFYFLKIFSKVFLSLKEKPLLSQYFQHKIIFGNTKRVEDFLLKVSKLYW